MFPVRKLCLEGFCSGKLIVRLSRALQPRLGVLPRCGRLLRLEPRGIVSMLTCDIQKFVRAFAFGIDSEALQLSPGVSNKLSDFWRGYVRQDDMPSVVLEAEHPSSVLY